jgi:hypothetical protein
MKALEYDRNGMFVPPDLTKEIVSKVKVKKNKSILVLFSYEMLPVLKELGYKNVTLGIDKVTPVVYYVAKYYGCKVFDIEDLEDMKFDVVLGNPPYQDSNNKAKNNKLWHKFVMQDLPVRENGYVAFVNPVSMFSYIGISEKILKKYTSEYSMIHVTTHDTLPKNPFSSVNVSTCHWIAKKCDYNGSTMYNGKIVDLRDRNSILSAEEMLRNGILEKVSSHAKMLRFCGQEIKPNDNGKFEYLVSGQKKIKSSTVPNDVGVLKYVVSFSSSYKTQFTTRENIAGFNRYIILDSPTQEEQIRSFMLSKLMIYYALNYRKTAGFTPAVKNNMIPDLRRQSNWTDKELYKFFGLTAEEIKAIES